jgi:hypothetical protein
MHYHVSCHLHIIYDESFCHKFLDTSLPCGFPCHHIYDECFCHKDFAVSHVISHVERHNCMNCDIFKHTYDKLEHHKFSDDCGVRQKIYDDFLLIVIVVHLTHTFCDDDLPIHHNGITKIQTMTKNYS